MGTGATRDARYRSSCVSAQLIDTSVLAGNITPQEPGTWAVSVVTIGELEVGILLAPNKRTSTATRPSHGNPRTSAGPGDRSPRRCALRTAASRLRPATSERPMDRRHSTCTRADAPHRRHPPSSTPRRPSDARHRVAGIATDHDRAFGVGAPGKRLTLHAGRSSRRCCFREIRQHDRRGRPRSLIALCATLDLSNGRLLSPRRRKSAKGRRGRPCSSFEREATGWRGAVRT